jgi:dTDP-4-amino-4,6-dideoxygalactose transaminase
MAIELAGARPLLVDIDPATFTLDPAKLEETLLGNPGCKALILVHLYGRPAAPECVAIARRHGLRIIEDCAQSHGAAVAGCTTGTWGDMAAFSFYPTKNLSTVGDGGAVLTGDGKLAAHVRRLHQYGWQERYISLEPGLNSRLDELQAAILRVKLPSLRADNARRARLADVYRQALVGTVYTTPSVPADVTHVFHQYVIRAPRRDALLARLLARGIPAGIHYPQPVHLQPAYRGRLAIGAGGMVATERACGEIMSLPMHPRLGEDAVQHVVAALREFA